MTITMFPVISLLWRLCVEYKLKISLGTKLSVKFLFQQGRNVYADDEMWVA